MKSLTLVLIILFSSIQSTYTIAQINNTDDESIGGAYHLSHNDEKHPCINKKQYEEIEKQCAQNIKALGLTYKSQKGTLQTSLNWPLKAAPGLDDCSFYIISAHVDQDFAPTAFKDYNCGTITYDGHKGTDIATFPYGIYKLDHDEVQVIAAAAGTIINKVDGNFDKNCGSNNLTANYIVIQHADGSTALYLHMKKNSLTTKGIGESVAVGEFLGVVGSSGNSSGPHLHFEVWSGSTSATYIDPFSGTCNSLNTSSWWAVQKPYTEPQIVKSSINTTDIVIPGCPATEIPNESACYTIPFQGPGLPAGYAKFYIFIRNETTGLTANMSILNPDGTTFNSWTYTSTASYNASYRSWSKTLPTKGGTYTFKATYNGITCEKQFDIVKAEITPLGATTICEGSSVGLQASLAKAYLWSNGDTTQTINVAKKGDYTVTITNVYGCTSVSAPINITVTMLPIAEITENGSTNFCEGGSLKLSSSPGSSFLWSTGESSQEINVSTTGNYLVTVTNSSGCSAISSSVSVIVHPNPVPTIGATGPLNFCKGESVNLISSPATSYIWSSGELSQMINVTLTGTYFVTVTDQNGCTGKAFISVIALDPQNNLKIIVMNDSLFSPYSDPSSWYLIGNVNPIASGQVIACEKSGVYYSTGYDINGCFAKSDTLLVNCETNATLNLNSGLNIKISPNPFNQYVHLNANSFPDGTYILSIRNILGQTVMSAITEVNTTKLDKELYLAYLPQGIYIISIENPYSIWSQLIIKKE